MLEDPDKRRRYDEAGIAEEDRPDIDRATALGLIEKFLGGAVDEFVLKGQRDPRHRDLFTEFAAWARNEIASAREGLEIGRKAKALVEDVARRITGTDPARSVERMFENRARDIARKIDEVETLIRRHELAIEIAAGYRFRSDPVGFKQWDFGDPRTMANMILGR